jgi:hypothetical protein
MTSGMLTCFVIVWSHAFAVSVDHQNVQGLLAGVDW